MWKKTSIYTVKKNSLISLKSTNARRPQKEVKNLTVKSPGKAKNLTIIRRYPSRYSLDLFRLYSPPQNLFN